MSGDIVHLNYQPRPTHAGSMLEYYASCVDTNTNFRCRVEIKHSSLIKDMYLRIEGINSRLAYPKCYVTLRYGEREVVLDFNLKHLQVFDIVQIDARHFAFLYEHTPQELDMAGIKKVGLIDLQELLKRN